MTNVLPSNIGAILTNVDELRFSNTVVMCMILKEFIPRRKFILQFFPRFIPNLRAMPFCQNMVNAPSHRPSHLSFLHAMYSFVTSTFTSSSILFFCVPCTIICATNISSKDIQGQNDRFAAIPGAFASCYCYSARYRIFIFFQSQRYFRPTSISLRPVSFPFPASHLDQSRYSHHQNTADCIVPKESDVDRDTEKAAAVFPMDE